MKKVKFSVIIPVKEINSYIRQCIKGILKQTVQNFEIIVIPDKSSGEKFPKTRIIDSGDVNPAKKRQLGIDVAKGSLIAFIDDDAYPAKDWLEKAAKNFSDSKIAAVGGPGLTPEEDSFLQKVGGEIYKSKIASGTEDYRNKIGKRREIDDYPSCNFIIRKDVMKKVNSFKNYEYQRGEDTKLCLDIIKTGKKIIYDPEVIIYHHRRAIFSKHLKQIWKCGLYRGFFARKFPKTSFRIAYFIPSLFVIGLVAGFLLSFVNIYLKTIYLLVIGVYILLLIIEMLKTKPKYWFLFLIGMFATHVAYGLSFIKGFLSRELK